LQATFPSGSLPLIVLDNIDIEITNDETGVLVGIRFKDECDSIFSFAILSNLESYHQLLPQFFEAKIELKNDLKSLFDGSRKLSSLITDGAGLSVYMKTNRHQYYKKMSKNLAEDDDDFELIIPMLQAFLQRGFDLQVGLDELKLSEIVGKTFLKDELDMDTSSIEPLLTDTLGEFKQMIDNSQEKIPIIGKLMESLKQNFKCDLSLIVKVAEAKVLVHFKSSGIKEFIEHIKY